MWGSLDGCRRVTLTLSGYLPDFHVGPADSPVTRRPKLATSQLCACRPKFWWTSTFNALGLIATFVILPDPARISLAETHRRCRYLTNGKTYNGEPIKAKSLSW